MSEVRGRNKVGGMTWWGYVMSTARGARQDDIAKKTKITAPTVSRWRTGTPSPEAAARFARAYGRPVLEAFVAAGFLTAAEAKARPAIAPGVETWTNEQLLAEIRRRLELARADDHGDGRADDHAEDEETVTRTEIAHAHEATGESATDPAPIRRLELG